MIGFGGGVITHDLTGLLPKRRGDLRPSTDLLLQLLPIPAFHQTIGAVACVDVAVQCRQHVAHALAGLGLLAGLVGNDQRAVSW